MVAENTHRHVIFANLIENAHHHVTLELCMALHSYAALVHGHAAPCMAPGRARRRRRLVHRVGPHLPALVHTLPRPASPKTSTPSAVIPPVIPHTVGAPAAYHADNVARLGVVIDLGRPRVAPCDTAGMTARWRLDRLLSADFGPVSYHLQPYTGFPSMTPKRPPGRRSGRCPVISLV